MLGQATLSLCSDRVQSARTWIGLAPKPGVGLENSLNSHSGLSEEELEAGDDVRWLDAMLALPTGNIMGLDKLMTPSDPQFPIE